MALAEGPRTVYRQNFAVRQCTVVEAGLVDLPDEWRHDLSRRAAAHNTADRQVIGSRENPLRVSALALQRAVDIDAHIGAIIRSCEVRPLSRRHAVAADSQSHD